MCIRDRLYLRDFLDGSDYYRMNTLFKFFNQVWVIWGIMGAIAVPRIFAEFVAGEGERNSVSVSRRVASGAWAVVFTLLLAASLAYPLLGTPARVDQPGLEARALGLGVDQDPQAVGQAQLVDVRGDDAEVLRDQRRGAELGVDR